MKAPYAEHCCATYYEGGVDNCEGSVDVGVMRDALQCAAAEAQMTHFGQTLSRLFIDPHPPRARAAMTATKLVLCLVPDSSDLPFVLAREFLMPLPSPGAMENPGGGGHMEEDVGEDPEMPFGGGGV
ncbi:hypothetical protein JKP88DRAFT_274200 [Tribonema minus]|uniref:BEACH domain-containing protein n=1 Tax=Tribonema minus TaxID=303371 RepID=A0A836CA56_9STRA|nr:hypothetical protein JKP88DRAFT_274200 [Tribonema minus]